MSTLVERLRELMTDLAGAVYYREQDEIKEARAKIEAEFERLQRELDRRSEVITQVNARCDHLGIRLGEVIRARDGLQRELEEARKDAQRYRALRAMNWNDSPLCVVVNPKQAVKLGHDCPSGDRLDEALDAAIDAARDKERT